MTTNDIDPTQTDTAGGNAAGDDALLLPFPPDPAPIPGDMGRGLVWGDVVAAIKRHDDDPRGRRRDSAA